MNQACTNRLWVPGMLCAGLLFLNSATAQQPADSTAPADQVQTESVLLVMKGELARAEARAASVTAQLVSLDNDIESRINRMISLLCSVRDSTDGSGNRIRKSKEDALAGIKATTLYYAQERDRRRKELEGGNSQKEEDVLAREVAVLNGRIESRVTQSLAIAESLVLHQEGRGSGDFNETQEQRKQRYDAQASVNVKADLVATLRASIDKQAREIAMRDEDLRTTTDPQKREQLAKDNEAARQVMQARRDQIEQLVTAPKAATRPVGGKAAFELDKMLDEMTAELRQDFSRFKALVYESDQARIRVKLMSDRLEQAMGAQGSMAVKPDPAGKAGETSKRQKGDGNEK